MKFFILSAVSLLFMGCSSSVPVSENLTPQPPADSASVEQKHEHHHKDHHHKTFKGAEEWAKEFDDPSRDTWQQPAKVLKILKLKPTDTVADLGAGTGYFAMKIAPLVPRGLVYAVDVEPDMVRYLESRAGQMGLKNIKPVLASETGFETTSQLDLLLVVDTYHHIGERSVYFKSLVPKFNKAGRLVIIDFLPSSPLGPPQAHRYQPPQIKKELEMAGYKFVRETKLPYQFLLEFKL